MKRILFVMSIALISILSFGFFNIYGTINYESNIKLTKDEKNWLEDLKRPVNIVIDSNNINETFFIDNYTGEDKGILLDVLDKIESDLGIKFNIIKQKNYSQSKYDQNNVGFDIYFDVFKESKEEIGIKTKEIFIDNYNVYSLNPTISRIDDFEDKTIGFLSDYSKDEFINTYPNITEKSKLVIYTNKNILESKLINGEIDGIISSKEIRDNKKGIIENFELKNITDKKSFFISDKYPILANIIDKEIEYLNTSGILDNIIKKNKKELSYSQLLLTKEEFEWLNNNKTIYIAAQKDYPPFDMINEANEYSGINSDYLKEIGELLNVDLKLYEGMYNHTFFDSLISLKTGKTHLMPSVSKTKDGEIDYLISEPYYDYELTIFGNEKIDNVSMINDLIGMKVALPVRNWQTDYIRKTLKGNIDIEFVKNIEEAIELVTKGEVDCTIADIIVVNEILKDKNYKDVKVLGKLDVIATSHFLISKEYPELESILNKVIKNIPYEAIFEEKAIITSNSKEYQYLIVIIIITTVIVIASFIMLVLSYYYIKKKKDVGINLSKQTERNQNILFHFIETLEEASIMNDAETGTHTKRVSYYCEFIARELGLDNNVINSIKQYASLHDLGKIGIPSTILKKPAKLTEKEYDIIKEHVEIGSKLIRRMHLGDIANNMIKYHHENWDGTGYLQGLKGEEIPIEARIMSLADVYDALRMKRIYKKPYSHKEAVDIILSEKGKKFDPKVVNVFKNNHDVFALIYACNYKTNE
ncbi:MAG: HD domain-containing phosphohydrolase [Eubacteriales bacterium]